MIAKPPDWCRWQSNVRLAVSLLPAIATVTLAVRGQWAAAAAVFLTTFVVISIGTILSTRKPRQRPALERYVSQLETEQ